MCGAPPFHTPWIGCGCDCTGSCASAGATALGGCTVDVSCDCTAAERGCAGRAAGALSPTAAAADMGGSAPAAAPTYSAPEANPSLSLLSVDGVLPVGLAVGSASNGGEISV